MELDQIRAKIEETCRNIVRLLDSYASQTGASQTTAQGVNK